MFHFQSYLLDFHHVWSRHTFQNECCWVKLIFIFVCPTPDLHEPRTEIHLIFQIRIVKETDTLHFHTPQTQKYFPFEVILKYS